MAIRWQSLLKYDPIAPLLEGEDKAIVFLVNKEFLGKKEDIATLQTLPIAQKISSHQQKNGSWKYPAARLNIRDQEDYDQIETYRNLGYLVEMYGFNKKSPLIKNAAEYIFSCQTKEGDIRGIYGRQYTPNYTAGLMELLIKAGYGEDKRIEKGFQWLIGIRQLDGGWTIPLRTLGKKLDTIAMEANTLQPDRDKPFSHLITGVVLRAFAAHEKYRNSQVATEAAKLLASHLFKRDSYPDRGTPDFWLRFTFPFWFTDLVSAMDSLSQLHISKNDAQIEKALEWLVKHQSKNGLWELKILKNKGYNSNLWVSLAICRILKRFYAKG